MKILLVVLVTVFINSQAKSVFQVYNQNSENLLTEDLKDNAAKLLGFSFNSKLEEIRQILKKGNESLGLPVCDPFQLEHHEEKLNLFNGTIKGSGSIDNLLFTGLSGYEVIKADISIFKRAMNLKLKWPHLEGTSFYTINAFIKNKMIEVYGGGDFEAIVENFVFETVAHFGLRSGKVYIKNMDTIISLGNFKFTIRGLYHDDGISETMSIFVSEFVKQVIQDNQKNLVNVVNSFIIVNANKYLGNKSFQDLLDLLN